MAYPNTTILESRFGSFVCDTAGALTIYQRVKFSTANVDNSGKPTIVAAGATDRAIGVCMQPIAVGLAGTISMLNGPGEQFGIASGPITAGALVYAAASGQVTASSGGGAYLAGIATTNGYDQNPFTYMPLTAIA